MDMTYGSESECATHYTTAPHMYVAALFCVYEYLFTYLLKSYIRNTHKPIVAIKMIINCRCPTHGNSANNTETMQMQYFKTLSPSSTRSTANAVARGKRSPGLIAPSQAKWIRLDLDGVIPFPAVQLSHITHASLWDTPGNKVRIGINRGGASMGVPQWGYINRGDASFKLKLLLFTKRFLQLPSSPLKIIIRETSHFIIWNWKLNFSRFVHVFDPKIGGRSQVRGAKFGFVGNPIPTFLQLPIVVICVFSQSTKT